MKLTFTNTFKNFEYEKNNNKYQNKAKLYKQVIEKLFFIIKTFYLRYSLYFLFNNVISHFIYTKDTFQV